LVLPVSGPKVPYRINQAPNAEFKMHKERQKPPKVRPSLIDRISLAASSGRQVDGIWIGTYFAPEHLPCVEHALLLVKQHSPLHYSRIIIWIFLLPDGLAEYKHSIRACVLDERFVADSATSVERIASAIVHEATHARLERHGVGYAEDQRARIEAICFRRELAFALRLPDSARLQQDIAGYLDWYPANPDYFRDAPAIERHANGEIEMFAISGRQTGLSELCPRLSRSSAGQEDCSASHPAVAASARSEAIADYSPGAHDRPQHHSAMYGPAVRCKRNFKSDDRESCINVFGL
jgi:hypothetical protein